ncbi:MAG: hypothetical protein CL820_00460 [Croceicoccus sp.]|nr:hypothetical protein [Croceicoccus sp.]MAL24360.1 hypothetical protein [Croceicoccus sp.]
MHSASDILDRLRDVANDEEQVPIGDVVEAMGARSFGPFIMLPALIEISPLGAVPGVPTFLALVIAITAAQLLFGRDHLWLPGFVRNRSAKSEKVLKAVDRLRPIAEWMDRWFHGRMKRFASGPFPRIAAACVIALAMTVPPLEFIPFASTAPMAAIAAFGLALIVRDGLLMLIAGVLTVAALGTGIALAGGGG